MKTRIFPTITFLLFLLLFAAFFPAFGCSNSGSQKTDPGSLIAVALSAGQSPFSSGPCDSQTNLVKGSPVTATVSSPSGGYYGMASSLVLYFLYQGGGSSDSVSFSSNPSGSSGGELNIGKQGVSIQPANLGMMSNFDVYHSQAPYSNSSVMTASGNYRCYQVIVPAATTITYTISIL